MHQKLNWHHTAKQFYALAGVACCSWHYESTALPPNIVSHQLSYFLFWFKSNIAQLTGGTVYMSPAISLRSPVASPINAAWHAQTKHRAAPQPRTLSPNYKAVARYVTALRNSISGEHIDMTQPDGYWRPKMELYQTFSNRFWQILFRRYQRHVCKLSNRHIYCFSVLPQNYSMRLEKQLIGNSIHISYTLQNIDAEKVQFICLFLRIRRILHPVSGYCH